jgi:hypothetical protein
MSHTNDELYAGLQDLYGRQIQLQERLLEQHKFHLALLALLAAKLPNLTPEEAASLTTASNRSSLVEQEEAFLEALKSGLEKLPKTSAKSPFTISPT